MRNRIRGLLACRFRVLTIVFANLFDRILPELTIEGIFPSVVVNESLQKELNAQIGDAILLSFEQSDDIHRESLFGRADDAVQTIRLTLAGVLPDREMGRFGLFARQTVPLNAFLSLPVLQKALGQRDRVNTLLVSGDSRCRRSGSSFPRCNAG